MRTAKGFLTSIYFLACLTAGLFLSESLYAYAPKLTYQGRIVKVTGGSLEASSVVFRLQILTPNSSSCLMYQEQKTLNMSGSNGVFSVTLNDGSGTRQDSTGWDLDHIFANRGTFTFSPATCADSTNTFTPALDSSRKLRVQFNDGSGWSDIPDMDIAMAPIAIESMQVNGFRSDNLLRVTDVAGVPQSLSPFSVAQHTELLALIGGTSTQYQRAGQIMGGTLPMGTMAHGYSLRMGSSGSWEAYDPGSGGGSGTVTSVVAGAGLAGGNIISAGTISLATVGTAGTGIKISYDQYGRVTGAAGLVEADLPNITSAGKVSGDAITSGTIAGTTSVNTSGTVAASQISTRGVHISNMEPKIISILAPASITPVGGYTLTLPVDTGTAGQFLSTNGSGTLSWTSVAAGSSGIASVSGSAPISVTGSTSLNVSIADATTGAKGVVQLATSGGTTAGHVVQADDPRLSNARTTSGTAGGDLTGSYPSPTVTAIRSVAVNATGPSGAGQVLRYNGTTEYAPAYLSLADIRSITGPGHLQTFPSTSCTAKQTLTWSSITDTLSCSDITLTAADITNAVVNGGQAGAVVVGSDNLNSLTFETNNSARVTIGSTGNVGIGTSTPGAKFSVAGGALDNAYFFRDNVDVANGIDGQSIYLFRKSSTDSAFRFYIDQYREGWITDDVSNPLTHLHIETTGWLSSVDLQGYGNGGVTLFGQASDGITRSLDISGFRTGDSLRTMGISVGGSAANTASFVGVGNYHFDGNVGVGTVSPTEKLDVAGNIKSSGTLGAAAVCIAGDCKTAWPSGGGGVTSISATNGLESLSGSAITTTGTIGLADTTVTAGSFGTATSVPGITVDAKGRLTAVANLAISNLNTSVLTSGTIDAARLPALTGDVSTLPGFTVTTLATTGVSASTYRSVTVDTKGRVTAGTNPTSISGYGITDAVINGGQNGAVVVGTNDLNILTLKTNNTAALTVGTTGRVGIGTTAPSSDLSFGGNANRTLKMENESTAANDGKSLTIQAGGSGSNANKNGGDLVLASGRATGNGYSSVGISFVGGAQGPGSTVRNPDTIALFNGNNRNIAFGVNSVASGLYSMAINLNGGSSINVSQDNTMAIMGGTVGIGTVTPTEKLDVSGNIKTSGTLSSAAVCIAGDCKTAWPAGGTSSSLTALGIGTAAPTAGLEINHGTNTNRGINLYSSAGATANNPLMQIYTSNAAFDQTGLDVTYNGTSEAVGIYNSGSSSGLYIGQSGDNRAFYAYSNVGASASDVLAQVHANNVAFDQTVFQVDNYGVGDSFRVNDQASDTTPFIIDASGNVGIGASSPNTKLHVYGAGDVVSTVQTTSGSGSSAALRLLGGASNADWHIVTNRADLNGAADNLGFYKTSGNVGTKVVIQNNGNVGIGTTTPGDALHVVRASGGAFVTAQSTNTNGSGFIAITNSGNNTYNGFYSGGAAAGSRQKFIGNMGGSLVFGLADDGWTTNTDQMVILTNGNVGIGTTTPGTALDVAGGVRAGSSATVTTCGMGEANGEGTQRYNYTTHAMEFCNGTSWIALGASVPVAKSQVFTSGGTFTTPAGTTTATQFKFTVVGGGGGGSGSGSGVFGTGGGGGAAAIYYGVGVAANTNVTITVGAAGSAGAGGGNGGDGGSSSVVFNGTTVTANGGGGGNYNSAEDPVATATNGSINMTGGRGSYAFGAGGGSLLGAGGPVGVSNGAGTAGSGYGGGGGGGSTGVGHAGGAGSQGIVIVEWVQ